MNYCLTNEENPRPSRVYYRDESQTDDGRRKGLVLLIFQSTLTGGYRGNVPKKKKN